MPVSLPAYTNRHRHQPRQVRQQSLVKLGLDYAALQQQFPALIYGHLSAFGRAGPQQHDPGYDFGAFWAQSGLMDIVRSSDDAPMPRELVGRFPHPQGRGTANILIVLWEDAATFSPVAATPTDDAASMEAMGKRGTDIDLPCLLDMYEESEHNAEWRCPKCKGLGSSIGTSFWKLPDVLIITLKRFDFAAGRKIASPVKFEPEIDLAPWLQDGGRDGRETIYELFGVVNHYGSMRFGHYTAFCRRKEGWFEFDDRAVHDKVDFDYSAAYVLFLRRKGLKSE